jgi:crotonobetainyl-CoA:carnitine CoA-transferase CaiB-like acyl-CoA transferase
LIAELDAIFALRTRDEWGGILDTHDVWWAPVQETDEVLADPQAWAGGGFVEVPEADGSTATMIASPVDFGEAPLAPRSMPPALGEHTDEILASLGYSAEAVAKLRDAGAVA